MAGELTPFEESIVSGGFTFEEGFTPVSNVAGQMALLHRIRRIGRPCHVIYKRDGYESRSGTPKPPLINDGNRTDRAAAAGRRLRS